MITYDVKSVVCDYGVYENDKLIVITNDYHNALLIKAILDKDNRNDNRRFSKLDLESFEIELNESTSTCQPVEGTGSTTLKQQMWNESETVLGDEYVELYEAQRLISKAYNKGLSDFVSTFKQSTHMENKLADDIAEKLFEPV